MLQGAANAPSRRRPGFGVELLVTQGRTSLDDLEIRPIVVLKQPSKNVLRHQEILFWVKDSAVGQDRQGLIENGAAKRNRPGIGRIVLGWKASVKLNLY